MDGPHGEEHGWLVHRPQLRYSSRPPPCRLEVGPDVFNVSYMAWLCLSGLGSHLKCLCSINDHVRVIIPHDGPG